MFEPRPEPEAAGLVVCTTCRMAPGMPCDPATGERGGTVFAAILERLVRDEPRYAGIAVDRMACLFACSTHCVVHLRGPGRMGYVMGRFEPGEDAARALLDYAVAYGATDEGVVPYAKWPEGVKGKFIVRTPPAGTVHVAD